MSRADVCTAVRTAVRVDIHLDFGGGRDIRPVGVLAVEGLDAYFAYDERFLASPLPVSPFLLPVDSTLYKHAEPQFDRLPGLLFDALPDRWGRLLQDCAFAPLGVAADRVTPLDRLAAVGSAGVGALVFAPATELWPADGAHWKTAPDLGAIADHAKRLYEGSDEPVLPQLLAGGGSPGGARPKLLAGVRLNTDGSADVYAGGATTSTGRATDLLDGYTPWIIKFPMPGERPDVGAIEAAYANMARQAGIDVPDTRLFATGDRRYFGIERFDRVGPRFADRMHVHTLGGLLHADYRQPSLDYETYLQVSYQLLGGSIPGAKEAFRRMVFNVLAHNRDDHVRNFAFLMSPTGAWRHSPAYDLTFSSGANGEHSTSIAGERRAPTLGHIYKVANSADLERGRAQKIVEEVSESVSAWSEHARAVGVPASIAARIDARLAAVRRAL